MAVSYMTKNGYDKIMAEINYLETVKRPEISAQIAEARDKGDLSENAEYDAAKEAQGIMEAKLAQLKGLIANARLIDESRVKTDEVQILIDGIGGSLIPIGMLVPLIRRQNRKAAARTVEIPRRAVSDILVKGERLILLQNPDGIDP